MQLVVIAALVSIAVTALLTWVLWRVNTPRRGDDGVAVFTPAVGSERHDGDASGADSGGGDGGGA